MSIFTRLNALIVAAILIMVVTVLLLRAQIVEQDEMTVEYRQVAMKENIANRLQANLFKKRISLLLYATSGNSQIIDRIEKIDSLIAQFMGDLRAQSVADEATLLQIETKMATYIKAQVVYLTQLEAIIRHANLAAEAVANISVHDQVDQKLHDLIVSELSALSTNPRSFELFDSLKTSIGRFVLEDNHTQPTDQPWLEQLMQSMGVMSRSIEQANEAASVLRATGEPLSKIIEDVKIRLKKQQDTLGPALREKIAATERLIQRATAVLVVLLLVMLIIARSKLLSPLKQAIELAKENLSALQAQNVRLRRALDTHATTTTTTTTGKTDELQQLASVAEEMALAVESSESLLAAYNTQQQRMSEIQKRVAIDNMLGGVSHNLNNFIQPITLLIGRVKTADDASKECLQHISTSVQKMKAIVAILLASSRLQDGGVTTRDTLLETIELVKISLSKTQTLDVTAIDTEASFVANIDPLAFQTVLLNLINNALDAEAPGRAMHIQIDAQTSQADRMITIKIADNGTGMSPEVLARAKDKFFTTKVVGNGTGLGVSEVVDLIERVGGSVTIDSTEGVGTTVTLQIPFAPEVTEELA